jgi:hypothetical protein
MGDKIIKIDKSTISNKVAGKSIDKTFSELIPKEDLVSLNQFFDYYDQLFYDIPRNGSNSHKKLIDQSTEFYGNYKDARDITIQQLEKRILELETQLLNSEMSGVQLEEKIEKTIKVSLKLKGGSKLGKKKSRKKKHYKVEFINHDGEKDVRTGSYNKFRSENLEFKTKPDFYQINVYGWVDRAGSKKDWVHMHSSGLVPLDNNTPFVITESIEIDPEKLER